MLTALLLAAAAGRLGAQPVLAPVDQGPRDQSFIAFRDTLRRTIESKDSAALLAVIDPAIKISFGDENGVEAFRRQFKPESSNSEVWRELAAVIALGGIFQGRDTFVAPYVFARWPDAIDSFDHVAVIGSGVRIRAKAASDGPLLATVSYAILEVAGTGSPADWTEVVLPDSRHGYVASRLTRSPIAYRAFFTRANGAWRLSLFVAGD